ncbi:hypothetical protein C8Q73DRAFT_794911 [Cubamyces lactineus]|nr:hypothetical protein C8Q73DRAFT_794911 [Cubamyces lactineus]
MANIVDPWPIDTHVFFLSGGKTYIGRVVGTETIEGLIFVIIKLDKGGTLVKFPGSSINEVTVPPEHTANNGSNVSPGDTP